MRGQYAFKHLETEILRHVAKGRAMRSVVYWIMLGNEEDLPKIRSRQSIHRADFKVVAKYLRTVYSVMKPKEQNNV